MFNGSCLYGEAEDSDDFIVIIYGLVVLMVG